MFKEIPWKYKDWDYIQLPKTKQKELVDYCRNILKEAVRDKKELFTNSVSNRNVYTQLLSNDKIGLIRQKFFELNAYLFKNYKSYVVKNDNQTLELNIDRFIEGEGGNNQELKEFHKKFFRNEYFDEEEYKQ